VLGSAHGCRRRLADLCPKKAKGRASMSGSSAGTSALQQGVRSVASGCSQLGFIQWSGSRVALKGHSLYKLIHAAKRSLLYPAVAAGQLNRQNLRWPSGAGRDSGR
jgi:hypothetical protein